MEPNTQPTPQEQQPSQPAFSPPQAAPPSPASGEDPGKGLAIAGLILAFFFSILGLILSIMAKKKSSAAGFHNTLATVAIILNAIFLALALIVIPLFTITLISYSGIQERAKTSLAKSTATQLLKYTEAYNAEHGFYPTSISEMDASDTSHVSDNEYFDVSLSPITKATATKKEGENTKAVLNLYGCKQAGNKIGYWDNTRDTEVYLYTVNTFDRADCSIVVD